jgi:hypothetical protein
MITARTRLSASYLTGLRAYLEAKVTGSGPRARAPGRAAMSTGLATRDLAPMHAPAVVAPTSAPARGTTVRADIPLHPLPTAA